MQAQLITLKFLCKKLTTNLSYNKKLFWNGTIDQRRNIYSKWSNISINYTVKQCMKQWNGYSKDCNCELVFIFITYLATECENNIFLGVFIADSKFKSHSICFGGRKAQRIWWASTSDMSRKRTTHTIQNAVKKLQHYNSCLCRDTKFSFAGWRDMIFLLSILLILSKITTCFAYYFCGL